MEGELYPLSQDIHSICLDNTSNSSFKVNEEIETNSLKNNETVKVEYMTYSNYNELPPNSSTINKEIDNLNIFSSENNYIKVAKGSLITIYNRQNDAGNSRRRQTFKCPYCPKVFCNSSAIAKHKLTHSDERKYVCDICGKAFKRQDHLNGHKHTHKVNKPHACHFCDRSYSDARSLKRHYENQHQKQYKEKMVARDSGSLVDDNGPSVIEAFGYFDEHKTVKCEVCGRGFKNQAALNGHMRLHGGYGQTKNSIAGPGEPKINIPFLENSTDNNSETTANVKKLTSLPRAHSNIIIVTRPETNTDRQVQAVRALLPSSVNSTSNFSSHCNSSSVIVLNSQHFTNSPKYDQSLSPTASIVMESSNLPNVSMEDLCLVLPQTAVHDRIHDPCNINSTADKSSPPIEMSTDGITYSQSNTKQSLTNTDLHKNHYSPITPAYTNKNGNMNMNVSEQNLFTYPSLVDNTQISGQSYNDSNLSFDNQSSDDYLMNFPAAFVTSSSNSVNKSWSFYELQSVETSDYNSNPPSLKKISSSNNLQDLLMNLDNLSDSNDITNNSVHSTNEDQSWSQFPDENSSINISNGNFGKQIKKEEEIILSNMESINCPPLNLNEHSDNNLSRKPLISEAQPQASHRKIKCRPAPIFIPPQTSAHMSRLRSPRVWNTSESSEQKIPPYTPPPMLSPQRRGSGLFNTLWQSSVKNSVNSACSFHSWNTPFSAKTITAVSNSYQPDSVASSLGDHQISTVLIDDYSNANIHYKFEKTNEPEHFIYQDDYIEPKPMSVDDKDGLPTSATPRINIGPEYQAHVSPFYLSKKTRSYKRGYDTLLWNPRHFKETTENISSLNLLMKIASSPAVKSCGLNMEYTFHLLFKYQGDLEKTLQTLLEESFVVYDYVYAETSNWTTEEIGKFQERLKAHDRDFMRVALDLQSYGMNKSVKACVEFYYVWKHMNNVKYVNAYRVKQRRKLITRNNTPQQEEDNYPPVIDSHFSTFSSTEGPYNLRKSRVSENQRPLKSFSYYGYKTSSGSSSREPSPTYQKLPKTISGLTQDNSVKKSRSSYQCSQCTRVFAKLKTLENHNRNHVHSKISRNKTQNRTVERPQYSIDRIVP